MKRKSKLKLVAPPDIAVSGGEWDRGYSVGHRQGMADAIRMLMSHAANHGVVIEIDESVKARAASVEREQSINRRIEDMERRLGLK